MAGVYQYEIELKSNVAKLLTDMKEVQDRLDSVEGREYKVNLGIDSKKLENVISNLDKMLTRLGRGTSDFKEFENLSKQLNTIVSEVQALNKEFGKINDSGISSLVSSIRNIDNSLTSLREHIVGVNKDFGNIGKNAGNNTSQINEARKATEGLANATNELADAQKSVGNKSNISSENQIVESQSKIREEINQTTSDIKNQTTELSRLIEYWKNVNNVKLQKNQEVNETAAYFNVKSGNITPYTEGEAGHLSQQLIDSIFNSAKIAVDGAIHSHGDWSKAAFSVGDLKTAYNDVLRGIKTQIVTSMDEVMTLDLNGVKGYDLKDIISEYEVRSNEAKEKLTKKGIDDINVLQTELQKILQELFDAKGLSSHLKLENISGYLKTNRPQRDFTPIKDVFQGESKAATEASASAIKEESKALEQVANTAKEASSSKTQFASANKEVKASAESSSSSLEEERAKIKEVGESADDVKKSLDNVVFKPNTEGFDEIVAKLGLAKEKASEIAKITKSSVWSESNGKYLESYNIRYKNGSSEIRGESTDNNGSNVLRANEVAYEAKAFSDLWEEANKVNNALNETRDTMYSLGRMPELGSQFSTLDTKIAELNNRLTSGKISVSDYKNEVKSLTSEYSKLVNIQQKRDVETYNQNAKALSFIESANKKLSSAISKYSYGDSTDATAMMKQLERGLGNFGDLSDVEGNISRLQSTINNIIADLKSSHEQSLSALNQEIKSEQELQSQKDAFHKRNISAIDLEIQKREEEAEMFSSTLKAQMEDRQSKLSSIQSLINTSDGNYEKWSTKPTDQNRSAEYQQALDKYKGLITSLREELTRLSNIPIINDEELKKSQELADSIKNSEKAIKSFSAAEKGSTLSARSKEIDKISKYLKENTKLSEEAKQKLREYIRILQEGGGAVNVEEINNAFLKVVATEREAGREGKSFLDIFKNKALYGFASQLAMYYLSFYDFVRYARNAINAIRELDTALIDLKKTTTMSDSQLENFYYSSNDVAKEMGVTTAEIINQASAWSRFNKIDPLYSNVY